MTDIALVTRYFGLKQRPFKLLPDPDMVFWSSKHRRAFDTLQYGLESRAPITLLTGEVGAGKTTLLRKLMEAAPPDLVIGLVSNVIGNKDELLHWILNALEVRVESGASYVTLFQTLQDILIDHYAAGRRVVLIFDEAQNIENAGLEELRMLTNINSGPDELLQLMLIGQTELRDAINGTDLRQLKQRVSANYHLTPLNKDDVTDYIVHLLQAAGGEGNEFTEDSIDTIFEQTDGIPRLVNQLCDFCMSRAVLNAEAFVSQKTVKSVLRDGTFVSSKMLVLGELDEI